MTRVLGLDPGSRRCGVAISDSERTMAFPRAAMTADDGLVALVRQLVHDEAVELVVVGRPVALSGNETASTEFADRLFAALESALAPISVVQCDERLTTREATRSLSSAGLRARAHRERVDSASAVVLLQHYLDSAR